MALLTHTYTDLKIPVNSITTGSVKTKKVEGQDRLFWDGTGSFDILVKSIDENIRSQYDNGRMSGVPYGDIYVKLIELALQKSLELQSLNAELQLKFDEIKLKEATTENNISISLKELVLKEKDLDLKTKEFKLKETEINANIALNTKEYLLKERDVDSTISAREKELALKERDITSSIALRNKEIELKTKQIELSAKEILLKDKQLSLTDKEIDVKTQQIAVMVKELEFKDKELKLKEKEFALREKELKLRTDQLEAELKLIPLKQENVRAQTKVYERQVEGFSDNLKLKLLEAQLNAFSMIFASGMLDFDQNNAAFPEALKATSLTESYQLVKNSAILDWIATDKHKVEERIKRGGTTSPIQL